MKTELSLEFDWFDEWVDLYFTQIDKQKEESKFQQKEAEIFKKMNRIKNDQLKRIEGLQKEQGNSLTKAKILQNNISEVQAIIEILNALLQSGLQWKEIWRMIKEEKRSGNPLANLIFGLDLEHEKAMLIFNPTEMDEDEFFTEGAENVMIKMDLDLTLSAQANIKKYFEIKKKTQYKEERTKDKAHEAIKQAEDQARKALLKTRNEQKLKTTRKLNWFEKYDWFISSENYLIISGRDSQQNEEVVKTYLGKRDVYFHSEMAGSASWIIKNPSMEEVSQLTLNETATWAICHSKAWDLKVVTSAFWVWGDQVSKTPQSGEYLVHGSFMIRGKKNFVNPMRLELGCTVMFKLDDDSVANHLNERRNRTKDPIDSLQINREKKENEDTSNEKVEEIMKKEEELMKADEEDSKIVNEIEEENKVEVWVKSDKGENPQENIKEQITEDKKTEEISVEQQEPEEKEDQIKEIIQEQDQEEDQPTTEQTPENITENKEDIENEEEQAEEKLSKKQRNRKDKVFSKKNEPKKKDENKSKFFNVNYFINSWPATTSERKENEAKKKE